MKLFLTMSLIETHKTRWDWKAILNVPLNMPLNETHKTTWRGLLWRTKADEYLYCPCCQPVSKAPACLALLTFFLNCWSLLKQVLRKTAAEHNAPGGELVSRLLLCFGETGSGLKTAIFKDILLEGQCQQVMTHGKGHERPSVLGARPGPWLRSLNYD